MDEATPSIQELVTIHMVHALDDALGDGDDIAVSPTEAVGITMNVIQNHFYLVPKKAVSEEGGLIDRPVPEDAVTDLVSNIWNKVSN